MDQEGSGWSPQPFCHTPPAPAGHRPSRSSWSGRGSCRAPGDCRPGCTGPSASPAPGACRTGGAIGRGEGTRGLRAASATPQWLPGPQPRWRGRGHRAERAEVRPGSPYLAVEAQGHRLVLQRHEEGAAIQLVLQVEHNRVDWDRECFGTGAAFWDRGSQPSAPGGEQGHIHAQGTALCFPPCSAGLRQLPPPPSHAAQSHKHVPPDPESFPREVSCLDDARQTPGAGFCRASPASGPFLTCAGSPALPLTQVRVPTLDGLAQGQLAPLHLQQQRDLLPGARLILQQLWPAERASACSPRA